MKIDRKTNSTTFSVWKQFRHNEQLIRFFICLFTAATLHASTGRSKFDILTWMIEYRFNIRDPTVPFPYAVSPRIKKKLFESWDGDELRRNFHSVLIRENISAVFSLLTVIDNLASSRIKFIFKNMNNTCKRHRQFWYDAVGEFVRIRGNLECSCRFQIAHRRKSSNNRATSKNACD